MTLRNAPQKCYKQMAREQPGSRRSWECSCPMWSRHHLRGGLCSDSELQKDPSRTFLLPHLLTSLSVCVCLAPATCLFFSLTNCSKHPFRCLVLSYCLALQLHLPGDMEAFWRVDSCPTLISQSRCPTIWWEWWWGLSKKEYPHTHIHNYFCVVLTQIP